MAIIFILVAFVLLFVIAILCLRPYMTSGSLYKRDNEFSYKEPKSMGYLLDENSLQSHNEKYWKIKNGYKLKILADIIEIPKEDLAEILETKEEEVEKMFLHGDITDEKLNTYVFKLADIIKRFVIHRSKEPEDMMPNWKEENHHTFYTDGGEEAIWYDIGLWKWLVSMGRPGICEAYSWVYKNYDDIGIC